MKENKDIEVREDMNILAEDDYIRIGEILMDKKGVTMYNIPLIEKLNPPIQKMDSLQKSIDYLQMWLIEVLTDEQELYEMKQEARSIKEKRDMKINEDKDIKEDE